jgi:hypothetical protein
MDRFRTRIPDSVVAESDSPEANAIDALPATTVSPIASRADAIRPEYPIRAVDPPASAKRTSKAKDATDAGPDFSTSAKTIRKDVRVAFASIAPAAAWPPIWA